MRTEPRHRSGDIILFLVGTACLLAMPVVAILVAYF
jgi:hypothetical protein